MVRELRRLGQRRLLLYGTWPGVCCCSSERGQGGDWKEQGERTLARAFILGSYIHEVNSAKLLQRPSLGDQPPIFSHGTTAPTNCSPSFASSTLRATIVPKTACDSSHHFPSVTVIKMLFVRVPLSIV